jgi:hypothetical protein
MPAEASAAQALQAALSRAGIKTTLRGYPTSSYYSDFAAAPDYVHSHDPGIAMGAWEPDWPDGYGMLDEISNGNTIVPSGNTNSEELNDPLVNELFARAAGLSNAAQRATIWGQISHRIMSDAAILPMGICEGAAVPQAGPHQRVHPVVLRHVQLRGAGAEVSRRTKPHVKPVVSAGSRAVCGGTPENSGWERRCANSARQRAAPSPPDARRSCRRHQMLPPSRWGSPSATTR